MDWAVPKPASRAIWSTDRPLDSSRCRARSTRCWVSHWPGLMPTSSRKRRVNVRTDMASCSAMSRSWIASWRRPSAHARAAVVVACCGSGTGRSMYCAWPPSRCGGTTVRRATSLATAVPWSRRTMCRHRSMPAATPAEVRTSPSSMNRTSWSTSICGNSRCSRSASAQCVVAGRPSRKPAAARTYTPVQMEARRVPGRTWARAAARSSVRTPSSKTGPSSYDAGTITVSAVASVSGPCSTMIAKSASVSTGPGGRTEQVTTSYRCRPAASLGRPKMRCGMPSSKGSRPSRARTTTRCGACGGVSGPRRLMARS